MGRFPSGQRGQTVNLLATPSKVRILLCPLKKEETARGSSLEARRAHNPEVAGSNPVPAIFYAQLAQLVEQRTENPRVSGSIPELGINYVRMSFGKRRTGKNGTDKGTLISNEVMGSRNASFFII